MLSLLYRKLILLICWAMITTSTTAQNGVVRALTKTLGREAGVIAERLAPKAERLAARLRTMPSSISAKGQFAFLALEQGRLKFSFHNGQKVESGIVDNTFISKMADDELLRNVCYIEPEAYFSEDFKPLQKRLQKVTIFHEEAFYILETNSDYLHITPSFYYKVQHANELISAINLKGWSLRKKNFHLAAVFSEKYDFDTYTKLRKLMKQEGIPFSMLDRDNMVKVFKKSKNKAVLLTGHFDGKQFFARDLSGKAIPNRTFSFEELEKLSSQYNVYTIYLGCETGSLTTGSGFLKSVYVDELIHRLTEAVNQRSVGQFLSCIGTMDNPIIIKNIRFENDRMIMEFEFPDMKVPNGGKVTFTVSTGLSPHENLPVGLHAFLLRTVNFWFVLGLLGLATLAFGLLKENHILTNIVGTVFILTLVYCIIGKLILIFFY